jgi:hypothetical protein
MSKTASFLLVLVVGAALGFALGRAPLGLPSLGGGDVSARVREILSGTDPLQRVSELSALLAKTSPDSLASVREGFQNSPLDVGEPEGTVVAQWWAGFDPKSAFDWAANDWRGGCGTVTSAVARIWAHSDPKAALEAVRKLRYPGQVEMGNEAIWAGWDEGGQPGLGEMLHTGSVRDQQRVAAILARRRVIQLGLDGAIHWVESFPDESMRPILSVRVASVAASISPETARKAAEWATPQIVAAARPTGFPRRIGTRWIRHDPKGALAWLQSLPAGLDRDDGVAESFRDWLLTDFDAAVAWIHEQTQGDIPQWTEPAISIFAKTNGTARPQETLELVARLQDAELRDSSAVVLLVHWMKKDRPAAEAWLAKATISDDVRQRVEIGVNAPRPPAGTPLMPSGPLGHDVPER